MKDIESDLIQFKENLQKVNSFSELIKLYNFYDNGKIRSLFKKLILKYNLSISHWKKEAHNKKWKIIEKICPVCHNQFTTKFGHPKQTFTCSYNCSNTLFKDKRHSIKSKKKTSNSIKEYLLSIGKVKIKIGNICRYVDPSKIIKCLNCKTEFISNGQNQKFCCSKCSAQFRINDANYIQKLKDSQVKRVKNGTHKGWQSRCNPSYAEKFFMTVLKNNNILYEFELMCGKYFIDFALKDKMIALEIDGKQHQYEDRKKKDIEKDKFLTEQGWKIYRISWKDINKKDGKEYMKQQIGKFVKFYNDK